MRWRRAALRIGGQDWPVCPAMGDLDGAREFFEQSVGIFRQVYDEDHPRTQTVLGSLKALDKG